MGRRVVVRRYRWIGIVAVAGVAGGMLAASPAQASSHREAPLIAQDPSADNTDVYAFRDPVDPTKVDLIANFIPAELPQAGPNFYGFGDDVLYEIHVDNDGDVDTDITYQFRFRTIVGSGDTFLYNTGQVTSLTDADLNVKQVYSVKKITAAGSTMIATDVPVPPANIGPRSTPNYETALGAAGVANLTGGGKVFAGPRQDPFFVDLGSVFDLLGLRPLNGAHLIPRTASAGVDGLAGENVHTIALQLPITEVNKNGVVPTTVDSKDSFIGVYSSASRQRVRVLSTVGGAPRNSGRWVQVSRLGIPLVNEVLIPLGLKDHWNATDPEDDAEFFPNILDPEPAKLIPVLYPGVTTPEGGFNGTTPKRTDIVAILTGQGAGLSAANALPPADLLRVNLAVAPTPSPDRLAILAGDAGGFPNGRRLGDDVVDIELRLLAGGTPFTPVFNISPNNALTDGVDADDTALLAAFPYVGAPFDGYSREVPGSAAP
jgi:hypothetical protein